MAVEGPPFLALIPENISASTPTVATVRAKTMPRAGRLVIDRDAALPGGHAEDRGAHWAALAVPEGASAGAVAGQAEVGKVGVQLGDHVVLQAGLLGEADAGEKSFTDCIVLALADLDCHGAVVLAGST